MKLRSKRDGAILNARLETPAEDTNYGNFLLMVDTADGEVALNMVEAQADYELVAADMKEQAELERAGYFLVQADR
jgi:hypothetical protein